MGPNLLPSIEMSPKLDTFELTFAVVISSAVVIVSKFQKAKIPRSPGLGLGLSRKATCAESALAAKRPAARMDVDLVFMIMVFWFFLVCE